MQIKWISIFFAIFSLLLGADPSFAKDSKVATQHMTIYSFTKERESAHFGALKIRFLKSYKIAGPAYPDDPLSVGTAEFPVVLLAFEVSDQNRELEFAKNRAPIRLSDSGIFLKYKVQVLEISSDLVKIQITED